MASLSIKYSIILNLIKMNLVFGNIGIEYPFIEYFPLFFFQQLQQRLQ